MKATLLSKLCVLAGDGIAFPDEETQNHLNQERLSASSSDFIAYNNVPMGVTHAKGKLIMTIPRRNPGIPATLSYISTKSPKGTSPSFRAFPNYRINELHVKMAQKLIFLTEICFVFSQKIYLTIAES